MQEKHSVASRPMPFFMPPAIEQRLIALISAISNKDIRESLLTILKKKDYNLMLRNAVNHEQYELTSFLLTKVPSVNVNSCGTITGQTALHLASAKGNLRIVELLVANGAFLNAMDKQALCPVVHAQLNEKFEVLYYLLSQGGMRYITNHAANMQVSLNGRSEKDKNTIRKIMQKLEECDNNLNARPSIENQFVCAFILKEASATLKNYQALNKSPNASKKFSMLPVFNFLSVNHIPVLTRERLLAIDKQYKNLPLDAMTSLLAKELINDESVLLPLPLASYSSTEMLIAGISLIPKEFVEAIKLRVHENVAAIVNDSAALLRWELIIDDNVISAQKISALAKKMGAVISTEKNIKKLFFSKIDAQVVADFTEFLQQLAPEDNRHTRMASGQ